MILCILACKALADAACAVYTAMNIIRATECSLWMKLEAATADKPESTNVCRPDTVHTHLHEAWKVKAMDEISQM